MWTGLKRTCWPTTSISNSHFILFLLSIRISYLSFTFNYGRNLFANRFWGNISFPSFELRRNSIMLMLKNTFISSSQNGERFPLNRKFAQAALLSCTVFHHRQNVLMMIYLPKYYNCARSLDSVCVCVCCPFWAVIFLSSIICSRIYWPRIEVFLLSTVPRSTNRTQQRRF